MVGGLMHMCLNQMQNISRNAWGSDGAKDAVSLSVLGDLLPNRKDINNHNFEFYPWLRFLDVVLRSLVITAASVSLNVDRPEALPRATALYQYEDFEKLCAALVDSYLIPALDSLEADGVKTVEGQTVSGHAVLLLHSLMTVREMRHAIKHGHPQRIYRMIKFCAPMFYGGSSYNYANESLELLHNLRHDWPEDTAEVLLAGMLVNTTGRSDGFVEGDMAMEHANKLIKGRAEGPGASPELLSKSTPAICHVQHLNDQLFKALYVKEAYQRHSHVSQEADVKILTAHMMRANIFQFDKDKASEHAISDLLRSGLRRLAGVHGRHAMHLARHVLRRRKRHGDDRDVVEKVAEDSDTVTAASCSREAQTADQLPARLIKMVERHEEELEMAWDIREAGEYTIKDDGEDIHLNESDLDLLVEHELSDKV